MVRVYSDRHFKKNSGAVKMECIHCGEKMNRKEKECRLCHRIRNGMPHRIFYLICARICSVYPVLNKRRKFRFHRPVGHPFCKNVSCVAEYPSYRDFLHRGRSLTARIKGPMISEKEYWKIIEKPCIFCGISPSNGVDRYDSSVGYVPGNVSSCCFQCNVMKKNIATDIFIDKIYEICTHGSRVWNKR